MPRTPGFSAGRPHAADELLPLVYDELRRLAAGYMARERRDHTLQPTALVNEAYMRLIQVERMDWRGRSHFLAMAATTLRRLLVDHARARATQKRGQGIQLETVNEHVALSESGVDVLEVEDALEKLAHVSPRQTQIVLLRFFGGLGIAETADVLGLSRDKVKSEWRFARAWLKRELGPEKGERR